jgi:hypothetical protein
MLRVIVTAALIVALSLGIWAATLPLHAEAKPHPWPGSCVYHYAHLWARGDLEPVQGSMALALILKLQANCDATGNWRTSGRGRRKVDPRPGATKVWAATVRATGSPQFVSEYLAHIYPGAEMKLAQPAGQCGHCGTPDYVVETTGPRTRVLKCVPGDHVYPLVHLDADAVEGCPGTAFYYAQPPS